MCRSSVISMGKCQSTVRGRSKALLVADRSTRSVASVWACPTVRRSRPSRRAEMHEQGVSRTCRRRGSSHHHVPTETSTCRHRRSRGSRDTPTIRRTVHQVNLAPFGRATAAGLVGPVGPEGVDLVGNDEGASVFGSSGHATGLAQYLDGLIQVRNGTQVCGKLAVPAVPPWPLAPLSRAVPCPPDAAGCCRTAAFSALGLVGPRRCSEGKGGAAMRGEVEASARPRFVYCNGSSKCTTQDMQSPPARLHSSPHEIGWITGTPAESRQRNAGRPSVAGGREQQTPGSPPTLIRFSTPGGRSTIEMSLRTLR